MKKTVTEKPEENSQIVTNIATPTIPNTPDPTVQGLIELGNNFISTQERVAATQTKTKLSIIRWVIIFMAVVIGLVSWRHADIFSDTLRTLLTFFAGFIAGAGFISKDGNK